MPQKLSLKLYAEAILEDVVVEPRGLAVTNFETVAQLGELVRAFKSFHLSLATGRPKEHQGKAEGDKRAS